VVVVALFVVPCNTGMDNGLAGFVDIVSSLRFDFFDFFFLLDDDFLEDVLMDVVLLDFMDFVVVELPLSRNDFQPRMDDDFLGGSDSNVRMDLLATDLCVDDGDDDDEKLFDGAVGAVVFAVIAFVDLGLLDFVLSLLLLADLLSFLISPALPRDGFLQYPYPRIDVDSTPGGSGAYDDAVRTPPDREDSSDTTDAAALCGMLVPGVTSWICGIVSV